MGTEVPTVPQGGTDVHQDHAVALRSADQVYARPGGRGRARRCGAPDTPPHRGSGLHTRGGRRRLRPDGGRGGHHRQYRRRFGRRFARAGVGAGRDGRQRPPQGGRCPRRSLHVRLPARCRPGRACAEELGEGEAGLASDTHK